MVWFLVFLGRRRTNVFGVSLEPTEQFFKGDDVFIDVFQFVELVFFLEVFSVARDRDTGLLELTGDLKASCASDVRLLFDDRQGERAVSSDVIVP